MAGSDAAVKRNPLETPMIRQYLELKAKAPDAILFFRMGDFYEMFLEDAVRVAPLLGLQLTSRNKGDPDEVPLCGFPHHQIDEYLGRLVSQGLKVAVGEQVEEDVSGKKIFRREIVRVVTPGLFTQGDGVLGAAGERPRSLVALVQRGRDKDAVLGLAVLHLATGHFEVTELHPSPEHALAAKLQDELARLDPAEILLEEASGVETLLKEWDSPQTIRPERYFSERDAVKRLCELFATQSLDGFGCAELSAGLCAARGIVEYVCETQGVSGTAHLRSLLPYSLERSLQLDRATRQHLELTRGSRDTRDQDTLFSILNQCRTRAGTRLLEQWLSSPLLDQQQIEKRYDCVDELKRTLEEAHPAAARVAEILDRLADIEKICGRIALGTATPRDCVALGQSLGSLSELAQAMESFQTPLLNDVRQRCLQTSLALWSQRIEARLAPAAPLAWKDGGFVREGFHSELDELRHLMRHTKEFIAEIEAREKRATGISSLKVRFNKVFGYYLEVTKSNLHQVPDYFIRKQTLVNAERFIVPDLKEFEEKLLTAQEKAVGLEREIFQELCRGLVEANPAFLEAARAVAMLDVLTTFAEAARQWNYVRPTLTEEPVFFIRDGRHAVLEQVALRRKEDRFIPNDLEMDAATRQILIITGPNMAGKSTLMRQLALLVIMAQMGSFVPAKEARLGLVDRIFTRVGASDSLASGQSTFMVEMNETANILHHATNRSLIILDEIGRGTSTFDGLSIAWAVAEYIHDRIGARTLFATHYHELAELPKTHGRTVNCNIAVKEWNDRIIFLRKLQEGATNRSYGIQVARLAGLPATVLARSRELLETLQAKGQVARVDQGVKNQLELFADRNDLLAELRALDPDQMTPLQALAWIQKKRTTLL